MRRRGLLLLLIWLIAGQGVGQGDNSLTIFTQANAAYENGDYAQAITLYHALENLFIEDAHVYYNLGNAYYQTGDIGRALVYYLRAQTLMPRDSDLIANIALVRAERVDIQSDETGILDGLAALTTGILQVVELAALVGLVWAFWCVVVTVFIVQRRWRETLRGPLLVVGAVVVFGGMLLVSRIYVAENHPAAVIIAARVQAMSGPGTDYLSLYPLYAAAEIRLMESRMGWVRFSLPDGRQGWLPEDVIMMVGE